MSYLRAPSDARLGVVAAPPTETLTEVAPRVAFRVSAQSLVSVSAPCRPLASGVRSRCLAKTAEVSAPTRPRVAPALSGLLSTLPQRGSFSLWRGPVRGEPLIAHRADEQHYAASMMKLALVIAAYRQSDLSRLHLDAPVTVHNRFRSAADGSEFSMDVDEDSDLEPWRRVGSSVALRWLCYRAIVRSSNLATNLGARSPWPGCGQ